MIPTQRLIEVTLDNGELIYIEPLSVWGQQALLDQIDIEHPAPDPAQFDQKLEGSILEASIPLEANEQYQKALTTHRELRNRIFLARIFEAGVVVDTPEGRQATLARHAERLAARRRLMKLPDDDWLACVMFVLVTGVADMLRVMNAATLTLREDEVRGALRAFRRSVQRT